MITCNCYYLNLRCVFVLMSTTYLVLIHDNDLNDDIYKYTYSLQNMCALNGTLLLIIKYKSRDLSTVQDSFDGTIYRGLIQDAAGGLAESQQV